MAAQIQSSQATVTYSTSDSTPSASGFIWPVGGPVVSPFGWRWGRMHEGIDIGAGYGAPIVASASGVVIFAGWMGGYGNLIIIDHGGGLATAYAHQSSFAVGGGPVSQGQTIGYVGCTGHCYGPHLHFRGARERRGGRPAGLSVTTAFAEASDAGSGLALPQTVISDGPMSQCKT